jgi:hypothetical protein
MKESFNVPVEDNEEFSKKVEALKERFSSIKFPADFEIKLTNDSNKSSLLHFLVKKEGAPNEVSVIVWAGFSGKDTPEWEIMTSNLDGDSLRRVKIDDTEDLVKVIEETLNFKPDEHDFHDDKDDIFDAEDDYHDYHDYHDNRDLDGSLSYKKEHSFEAKSEKFNIEDFKNNFNDILIKYVRVEFKLEGVHDYEENQTAEEANAIKEKELEAEMDTLIKKMVSLAVESLKLTDNKQEVLDTIYKSLSDSYEDFYDSLDGPYALRKTEKNYFQKLILELSSAK